MDLAKLRNFGRVRMRVSEMMVGWKGPIRMCRLRVAWSSVLIFMAAAAPASSENLADRLIEFHQRSCSEQNLFIPDLRNEGKAPLPNLIDVSAENYYQLNILGQQGYAEVIMLKGACGTDADGFCGSAGCLGYIIFEDRLVIEFIGGHPFIAFSEDGGAQGNLIIFPKAPAECQQFTLPEATSNRVVECYTIGYWDGQTFTAGDRLREIQTPFNE